MKDIDSQRGVSLIITFFIMIIILVIVLSISTLLYGEIKLMRNVGNSMVSLFAADSGIEKVLYYDRQVLQVQPGDSSCESNDDCSNGYFCNNLTCTTRRGLCSMIDGINNPRYCEEDQGDPLTDKSIFCNPTPGDTNPLVPQGNDCDPTTCTDCTVKFSTDIGGASYTIEASVDPTYYYSNITSRGAFGGAGRKIQIVSPR